MIRSLFLALILASVPAWADPAPVFTPARGPAPFSAAVRVGDILYLSGQIGVGPDGKLASGFGAQIRQTMTNIEGALAAAGGRMEDVFKCTVFLADMNNWAEFNAAYVTYFRPGRLPARSALGTNGLAAGAALELECMAYSPTH